MVIMSVIKLTSVQHTRLYNLICPGYMDDLAQAQDMVFRIYHSFPPNPTHPSFMCMKKIAFLIGSLRFSQMSKDARRDKLGECLNSIATLHDWTYQTSQTLP